MVLFCISLMTNKVRPFFFFSGTGDVAPIVVCLPSMREDPEFLETLR